jgi:pyrrolysine biosynthesis protein PylD
MTRLITEWLDTHCEEMEVYGASVKSLTGLTPPALAARSAARMARDYPSAARRLSGVGELDSVRVGVVRVTAGLGVIGGFTESLAALAAWLGAEVIVPEETDVSGYYKAVTAGAQLIFLADDDRFICVNANTGAIAENDRCTAYAYTEALDLMARRAGDGRTSNGLAGQDVLLLGYGRVGRHALQSLEEIGARVYIYDVIPDLIRYPANVRVVAGRADIPRFRYIFDATSEGGWLGAEEISAGTLFSAPGLPSSLSVEAAEKLNGSVFADALQTGAATMLFNAYLSSQSMIGG